METKANASSSLSSDVTSSKVECMCSKSDSHDVISGWEGDCINNIQTEQRCFCLQYEILRRSDNQSVCSVCSCSAFLRASLLVQIFSGFSQSIPASKLSDPKRGQNEEEIFSHRLWSSTVGF